MKFTLPESIPLSSKGVQLSVHTLKLYKAQLNKITKYTSYTTVEDLIEHANEVVDALKTNWTADDVRRRALFAIFWVISDPEYLKSSNAYHTYYQTILPATFKGSEKKWVKKSDYTQGTGSPDAASSSPHSSTA